MFIIVFPQYNYRLMWSCYCYSSITFFRFYIIPLNLKGTLDSEKWKGLKLYLDKSHNKSPDKSLSFGCRGVELRSVGESVHLNLFIFLVGPNYLICNGCRLSFHIVFPSPNLGREFHLVVIFYKGVFWGEDWVHKCDSGWTSSSPIFFLSSGPYDRVRTSGFWNSPTSAS